MRCPGRILFLILPFLFLLHPGLQNACCQIVSRDSLPADIFEGDDLLQLTLVADFDSIFADAAASRAVERAALLRYRSKTGAWVKQTVKVETRGNFRRRPQNCNFPPLRISFHESDSLRPLFSRNKTLKLVNQCQMQNPDYEQYLLEEYLLYKIYASLTPYAIRVRLLRLTYIDQGKSFDTISRYAFVLESPQELARRFQCKRIVSNSVEVKKAEPQQYKLLCFFEYMISNNDWSVAINHNVELLQTDTASAYIPVPYDFDWAGIIHVPYKVPGSYGMETIQPERSFKGEYRHRREVRDMIKFFREKQPGIYAMISGFKPLDDWHKLSLLAGLKEYYRILNNYFLFRKGILKKVVINPEEPAGSGSYPQQNEQ